MYIALCIILIVNCYFVVADNGERGSSLVFVFDTTGSMYNDLKQLREGAELILDTALKSENNVIDNFVFVPFHDPGVGPATVTRDKEEFKSVLNIVNVYGGGDCREMSLGGIKLALNVSLPRSYIYVFTDATAQDHHLINNILDLVQRKQSQVVFILTGHCNDLYKPSFQVYQQIAAASSGQLFNLNKTSVHKVLEFVRSSITGRTVNLVSVVNPAGTNYTQKIPVDSTVGEVTVSISGSRPHIKVVNPLGEHIKGPPKLVTTLDLSEIMVVKVMQPESGNWTINVGSDVDYSVKVVGLSNLTFQHGFFTQRPNRWKDTAYRPLKGADNYMIISLTKINVPIKITYAEILTLDGKKLFELPLRETTLKGSYLAEAFVPPDGFFYIAINGYDENNQELRRIGATAIQAKLPEAPILTVSSEIDIGIHDDGTLSCYVESLVPFTAQWYKGNKRLQRPVSSLISTYVDYTIDNMSEDKEGSYRCIAKNVAGVSASTTKVNIISNPPHISMSVNATTLSITDVVNISCAVYSESKLIHAELQFQGLHQKNVVNITKIINSNGYYSKIITVSKEDSGIYTCVAVNKAGESKETTEFKVIDNPQAILSKSIQIPIKLFSRIQIQCQIENANDAQIVAPNGTILLTEQILNFRKHIVILDLSNVTMDYSGLWTCRAKRNQHISIDSAQVTVIMDPKVKIEGSKHVVLDFGYNVTINCVVIGHPAPKITWFNSTFDDQHMKVIQKPASSAAETQYISQLVLVNINENSEQTYYCVANNSDIIINDSITVNVKKDIIVLQRPEDIAVDIYGDTKLYCKVDSYPKSQIIWYHNNTKAISNDKLNISSGNSTITIKNVDFTNTGVYSCNISNKYETIVLSSTVNVQNFESPELFKKPTQLSIIHGNSVNITCRYLKGKPIPQLTWFYINKHTNEMSLPIDVIADNNLFIPKVTLEHEGIYKCRAENIIGEDTYDLKLVVLYAPQLQKMNLNKQNIETKSGTKIVLECNVYSVPYPLVVWLKNNETIAYSKNIYINEKSNLIIDVTTEHDSGVFVCNASNRFGSVQRNFTLFVYVPPFISNAPLDPIVEVLEGQMVVLPCTPGGHPKPYIRWLHNGNIVEETLKKQIDNEFTLRFVSNLTDFGEYTCTATNKFGFMSYTYTVLVWVPPTIDLPLNTTQDVTIGAEVHIQCNAMGFPIPTIFWEYEDEIFIKNTTNIKFNDIGNLHIRNVSNDNKGVYVCIAENIAGFARKYIQFNVNEPPRIIEENYSSPYIASNKDLFISIPCRATGNPRPTIFWTNDNNLHTTDSRYSTEIDGTLSIYQPSEELSGNFTCTASNKHGTSNKTISVQIYSIPEPFPNEEPTNIVKFVENTTVNMTCPFRTSKNDIIRWYKDGHLISTGSKEFKNISKDDEGTYACIITNPIGSASSTVQLIVEWPPRFLNENYTKSLEIVKGDDCYLDCDVDAKPSAQIKWLHDSEVLQNENNKLKIINTQIEKSGRYSCIVTNKHGDVSRNFNLEVLEPPFISEFDLLDIQIKEGTSGTLKCEGKGTPKPAVLWTYNNTNWKLYNNTLMSINSTKESEGLFRCDARNKAGSTYIVYRVAVVTPATINNLMLHLNDSFYEVDKEVEVKKGSDIKLSCEANGNPIPNIKWIRNGEILKENQLLTYLDLVIHDINISDGGKYMCSIANEFGIDEKTINIEILEPPTIYKSLLELKNTSQNFIELNIIHGQAFYLHCHPYGNPIPQVYWFKDDIPLRLFDQTMYSAEFGEVLVSNSAREEHSGNYTCVVRNKVGQSSIAYLVNVLVPPTQPKSNVKRFRSRVGNSIKLSCLNDGRPLPQATWVKHPYIRITEEYDSRMEISENNYTLVIKNLNVKDGGNYSCILTNFAGTMEVVYELIVEKPAKIMSNVNNSYVENILVPMLRSVILKCPLDGYPQPKLTWMKDMITLRLNVSNLYQAEDDYLLIIWNAQANDAGQYICVAENTAGTDHRRFNVNIKVPGKWSVWSHWSLCNVSCGLGYQHRDRTCQFVDNDIIIDNSLNKTHPYLVLDDTMCKGSNADIRKCHMPSCEDDSDSEPQWLNWSKWSQCSATCGVGSQTRTRRCVRKGARCSGDNVQIRKCEASSPCSREVLESDNDDIDVNPYEPESTYVEDINLEVDDLDIETGPKYSVKPVPRSDYFYVNVTENLEHSAYEPCKPGFKYNDATQECQDVDECLIDNNHCHPTQICSNTAGGYRCSCQRGYIAFGAGQRCLDVNECSQNIHGCEFACVNIAGGYVCACPQHLRLHTDRRTCIGVRRRHSSDEDILSANKDYSKFTKKYRN